VIPASLDGLVGPKVKAALDWSLLNIGVSEDPVGSNRSPEIDAWATEFGSPLGSYWCALFVGKARKQAGLWIPSRAVGSCDEWYLQAEQLGLLSKTPYHGAAVLYTNGKSITEGRYHGRLDAVHIGLVLRIRPVAQSIEGNTTLGKYDRNGYTLTHKEIEAKRVLGYVAPERPANAG
jgi:hypothetical protein